MGLYCYALKNEQYYLMDGEEVIAEPLDEVAIAFSTPNFEGDFFTLHKHGDVKNVEAWADNARSSFRKSGFDDMAEAIVVLSGKFDVDQLNRALDTTGYISRFLDYHNININDNGDCSSLSM